MNNKRSRKKQNKSIFLPILILAAVFLFAAMVVYGWQSREKKSAVAQSESVTEDTVEVNPSENTTAAEIEAISETAAETETEAETTTAAPIDENSKIVYFTFDDGPWSGTPRLLDILDQYGIKACFFETAQYMEGSKLTDMIAETKNRGHNIGVHSLTHDYKKIYASVDAFLEDYHAMDDIIFNATGEHAKVMRFPGGSNTGYNKAIRSEVLQAVRDMGVVYFDWNSYDGDNDGKKGQELIDYALGQIRQNKHSILLMHDMPSTSFVHDALPTIIETLQAEGYKFELLDENTPPRQFAQ